MIEITNTELLERIKAIAQETNQPLEAYVENLLKQGLEQDVLAQLRVTGDDRGYATQDEIAVARELYQTDEVNIDEPARISIADEHFWVQAWVCVSNEEFEKYRKKLGRQARRERKKAVKE